MNKYIYFNIYASSFWGTTTIQRGGPHSDGLFRIRGIAVVRQHPDVLDRRRTRHPGIRSRIGCRRLDQLRARAVVLDRSGSMAELTRDGQVKMDVARQVVSELVANMPETLRVTLVIYGHDRQLNCQAVQVIRPLSDSIRPANPSWLTRSRACGRSVERRSPRRSTSRGKSLPGTMPPCGLVLLTDGKETCRGNPVEVASALGRQTSALVRSERDRL